jgi:hypothetical protein
MVFSRGYILGRIFMPINVERHSELPALIFTYSGAITLQDMMESYHQSLGLLTPDDHLIYRIVHVDNLESNFAEILKIVQTSASASTAPTPSTGTDRQMPQIVVGHDKWTKLYLQMMNQRQFGGISIPCFVTIDQALNYVRDQLQSEAP